MQITDIQKTKKGRYALSVDGEFLFSVHPDSYLKTGLSVGQTLDVQQLEQLRCNDQLLSAKSSALDCLSRSSQTSGMLLQKLLRHYDPDAAEAAVERMQELGLVDDADYARRYTSDCLQLRGWSLSRARQALLQKKLPRELVDEVLEQFAEHDETDPLCDLLQKKYRNKLSTPDDLRRTVAALQRRGFRYDDIRVALRRVAEEAE